MVETIKSTTNYPKQINEHNALADARWNYELYKFLMELWVTQNISFYNGGTCLSELLEEYLLKIIK